MKQILEPAVTVRAQIWLGGHANTCGNVAVENEYLISVNWISINFEEGETLNGEIEPKPKDFKGEPSKTGAIHNWATRNTGIFRARRTRAIVSTLLRTSGLKSIFSQRNQDLFCPPPTKKNQKKISGNIYEPLPQMVANL